MSKKEPKEKKAETVAETVLKQNQQHHEELMKQNAEHYEAETKQSETIITLLQELVDKEEARVNIEAHNTSQPKLELDPTTLANLPWRPYKRGGGAWIFSNTQGAEKLVQLIRESQTGKVPIGNIEYKFSGEQDKFISRNPIK